jgi:hypothetical protein
MDNRDLYYRYSGRMPMHAPLVIIAASCAMMAIVGAIYGILVRYSPIIYLNILGTVGAGMLAGYLVKKLGMKLQVRRFAVYPVAALVAGAVALYLSWISWITVLSDWQVVIIDPVSLYSLMLEIGEQGVWSLRHSKTPVNGAPLFIVWALEAGTLLIAPMVVAMGMRDEAYCETVGRWLDQSRELGPFEPIADPKAFREELEQDIARVSDLKPLGKQPEHNDKFTTITLRHAGDAQSTHLLEVTGITMKVEKGKVNLKRSEVVRHLLIDRATHDLIAELLTQQEAVMPNDAAAPPTAPPTAPPVG